MRIYLLIAAIAGGVTWLVTPLIRHVAIEIGAVGEVRARDVHTIPTPRMGGLGMLIGFAVATVFASRLPFLSGLFNGNYQMWVILGNKNGHTAKNTIMTPMMAMNRPKPTSSIFASSVIAPLA